MTPSGADRTVGAIQKVRDLPGSFALFDQVDHVNFVWCQGHVPGGEFGGKRCGNLFQVGFNNSGECGLCVGEAGLFKSFNERKHKFPDIGNDFFLQLQPVFFPLL